MAFLKRIKTPLLILYTFVLALAIGFCTALVMDDNQQKVAQVQHGTVTYEQGFQAGVLHMLETDQFLRKTHPQLYCTGELTAADVK